MRVILLGANGMLGSMLEFVGSTQTTNQIIPIKRDTFDALHQSSTTLIEFMKEPCCVVNCIGAIPQRSYHEADMITLNTTFPLELAELCNKMNVSLIHISTNCVFSGEESNCIESDPLSATDLYGKSKANGEPSTCVVLRCSIIGPESSGTAVGLLEWFLHSNESVSGYTDHDWNGLTTLELSRCIYEIIDKQLFTPRIEHLFSSNTLSKYDMLLEMNQCFNKNSKIYPISKGLKHYTLQSIRRGPQKTIQEQIQELSSIINAYREYMLKDIFLITSVIQTGSNAWSYTHIRSVFTPQQRFEQTLKTISSIRALKDGSRIIVCECSPLNEKMEQILREKSDIYLNCYHNAEIQEACIHTNKKGYGELLQTKYTLQYVDAHRIQYKRMFKISGRYWLTSTFDKSRFSTTEYTFNEILPNSSCHPTVLYSIPYQCVSHFHNVISKCDEIYHQEPIGLEVILPPRCSPKQSISGVGVAGYVAVDGTLYSTP
jgi:dTDP-4-dehydrorhamnose reductase